MTQMRVDSARPTGVGRMTAVMRAMAPENGPRRLRIAVVSDGRVVEERIVAPGEHLTIGSSERASVLLATQALPPLFRLFEHSKSGYRLRLLDGMAGRVSLDGVRQVVDLPKDTPIQLPNDARGKIVIGTTTLLFQLVMPPPRAAKPQLPISVERRFASQVDWFTTVVASFSFLLHFFAVALVYSDWMDPVLDDEYAVAQLVETLRPAPAPPVESPITAPEATADASAAPDAQAPTTSKKAPAGSAGTPSAGTRSAEGRGSASSNGDALAADIGDQLSQLNVEALRVLDASGPSIDTVLGDGNVPADRLEEAARSRQGAQDGGPNALDGLEGNASNNFRPGARQRDGLQTIGNERAEGGEATHEGAIQETRGPQGTAQASGASQNGSVPGAEGVVARMRGRFRHCYQRGLDNFNPEMAGSLSLVVKVGEAGQVMSVAGGGGPLGPIVPCLKVVVGSAQFQAPSQGAGIVLISITFAKR